VVAEKTVKDTRGLLYYAAPGIINLFLGLVPYHYGFLIPYWTGSSSFLRVEGQNTALWWRNSNGKGSLSLGWT